MINSPESKKIKELFLNAFLSTSTNDLLQLAKYYYQKGDISAGLSLASHCLEFQDSLNKIKPSEPLYLMAMMFHDRRYSRKYWFRFLALAIIKDRNIRNYRYLGFLKGDSFWFFIYNIFMLMFIFFRIILFQFISTYPKSLFSNFRKFIKFFP